MRASCADTMHTARLAIIGWFEDVRRSPFRTAAAKLEREKLLLERHVGKGTKVKLNELLLLLGVRPGR